MNIVLQYRTPKLGNDLLLYLQYICPSVLSSVYMFTLDQHFYKEILAL